MVSKFIHAITAPFSIYFDLCVAAPCRDVSHHAKERGSTKHTPTEKHRIRSLFGCISRQREMMSPDTKPGLIAVQSVRHHYIRDTHLEVESARWLH